MSLKSYLALAAVALSFGSGWMVQDWRGDKKIAEMQAEAATAAKEAETAALEKVREIEQLQAQLGATVAAKQAAEAEAAKVVTKTITKEVIKYVKSSDAGKCALPSDWVRIHNAAASGMPDTDTADGSSGTNEATSGFDDVDALEVVTENYGTCRETATRLRNLQLWAQGLQDGTKED